MSLSQHSRSLKRVHRRTPPGSKDHHRHSLVGYTPPNKAVERQAS
jgi:hypothetical protein